jgi:hypothetical protein
LPTACRRRRTSVRPRPKATTPKPKQSLASVGAASGKANANGRGSARNGKGNNICCNLRDMKGRMVHEHCSVGAGRAVPAAHTTKALGGRLQEGIPLSVRQVCQRYSTVGYGACGPAWCMLYEWRTRIASDGRHALSPQANLSRSSTPHCPETHTHVRTRTYTHRSAIAKPSLASSESSDTHSHCTSS